MFHLQLKSTTRLLKLGHNWVFQQDNDPKFRSNLILDWIKQTKIISLKINKIKH